MIATADRTALPAAELDDLDVRRLEGFIAARAPSLLAAVGVEAAALKLGYLGKVAGKLAPTPAGLLAFGLHPQCIEPHWGIGLAIVDGLTVADPIRGRLDAEGNLRQLVDASLKFIDDGTRPRCPEATSSVRLALREAIVNAIVHRDLRRPGRSLVRAFRDRIEVWSPGGLVDGTPDLDELSEGGISLSRNPLLSATARDLGLCEQLGRGLASMKRIAASVGGRLEMRATSRDILLVLPSFHEPPRAAETLS